MYFNTLSARHSTFAHVGKMSKLTFERKVELISHGKSEYYKSIKRNERKRKVDVLKEKQQEEKI